jgi:uncharacterized protein (TIGR03435 family)
VKLKQAAPGSDAAQTVPDTDPSICPPQNFNCAPMIRNIGGVQTRVTPVTGQVRKLSNPQIGVATMTGLEPGKSKIEVPSTSLEGLADVLTYQIGPQVIDATGGKGRYEVVLEVSVNVEQMRAQVEAALGAAQAAGPGASPVPPDPTGDPMFVAYQNALQKVGLRLESRKAPVETIVVDRIEKNPTEN